MPHSSLFAEPQPAKILRLRVSVLGTRDSGERSSSSRVLSPSADTRQCSLHQLPRAHGQVGCHSAFVRRSQATAAPRSGGTPLPHQIRTSLVSSLALEAEWPETAPFASSATTAYGIHGRCFRNPLGPNTPEGVAADKKAGGNEASAQSEEEPPPLQHSGLQQNSTANDAAAAAGDLSNR